MINTQKIDPEAAKRMVEAQQAAQLQVKELAAALGVCVRYVYEMRRLGFPMTGKWYHGKTASADQARAWVDKTGFRMTDGYGHFSESAK